MATQEQLEKLYVKAKDAYYSGNEIMDDSQFDILEEKLKNMGSKICYVGTRVAGNKRHPSPMLSLGKENVLNDDTYDDIKGNIIEIYKWMAKLVTLGNKLYEYNLKYDGCSMNLIYDNGVLEDAIIRGDGAMGNSYRREMAIIVPNVIPVKHRMEIRGEVLIEKAVFDKKYFPQGYKNERNFISPVLGRDILAVDIIKDFVFMGYELRIHKDGDWFYSTKTNSVNAIEAMGFNSKHPVYKIITSKKDDFYAIYKKFKEYREKECLFRLDGMVIKGEERIRKQMGVTGHHPKWALAIKFPPKDAITKIRDIEWNTGTTGEVVPKALLVPLELDGTEVKKAALFNKKWVIDKGAWPGAEVMIAKAGDIIPQVYKVTKPSTLVTPMPTNCPSCKSILEEDETHLWCRNDDCPSRVLKKIEAGAKIFEFEEIGGSTVSSFFDCGIEKIEDYFDKRKFNKHNLVRNGYPDGRNLEKKLDGVNIIDNVTLKQVIWSLKIKDVGESISEQIANYIADEEYDFKGLTKVAVENILDQNSDNRKRLNEFLVLLELNHIDVVYPSAKDSSLKTIEMTGNPPTLGHLKVKADWYNYLKSYGFIKGKVNKTLDYMLKQDTAWTSNKTTAADKHGVPTYTYIDFIKEIIKDESLLEAEVVNDSTNVKSKKSDNTQKTLPLF